MKIYHVAWYCYSSKAIVSEKSVDLKRLGCETPDFERFELEKQIPNFWEKMKSEGPRLVKVGKPLVSGESSIRYR